MTQLQHGGGTLPVSELLRASGSGARDLNSMTALLQLCVAGVDLNGCGRGGDDRVIY